MNERGFGEDINKKPAKKTGDAEISRRKFLSLLGGVAAGAALGYPVKKTLDWAGREIVETDTGKEKEREKPKAEQKAAGDPGSQSEIRRELPLPPAERGYVRGQDQKAVQKLLGEFNLEPINLAGVEKATENYIYFQHVDDPKLTQSLEDGYIAMQKYIPQLKAIFKKAGVPEKYIYLALSESYWKLDDKSSAGAVGPYQITEKTAELFDMNPKDRRDPLKSAELCALHLANIHAKAESWPVAVCGYNGQYANQCMGELWEKNHDHKCDYAQYEAFMEDKINHLKQKLRSGVWEHKVSDKESVSRIAKEYGLSWQVIVEYNQLKRDKHGNPIIQVGEILKIPMDSLKTKKLVYNNEIAGIVENLNYVPRFRAIYTRIHERDFLEKVAEKKDAKKIKIAREHLKSAY